MATLYLLKGYIQFFSIFISKILKPKFIIDDIGIGFKRQCLLNLSLWQFPFLWDKNFYKENTYNKDLRNKFLNSLKFSNKKRRILRVHV